MTQGQKSLKVNFQMNEPSEVIVQYPYAIEPRNLKGSTLFFIDVFLDVRETVLFSMALQVGSEWKWTESEPITLKKGMHFDLPVHFKTFDSFDEVKVINLKLYIPTPQSSGTVYYDNLRFFKKMPNGEIQQ